MKRESFVVDGADRRPILLDVTHDEKLKAATGRTLIFAHGFKGFKDWGHFGLIADGFAEYGINVVKFSFSHGGTTVEHPVDFADLEAFGNNTITRECHDLKCVIDWVEGFFPDTSIALLGHSRGGAIVLLSGIEDDRVGAVVTWSSISGFDRYVEGDFVASWREKGVRFFPNARTGQNMPMYFGFYEDFMGNRTAFDPRKKLKRSHKPCLFIHGDNDESVPLDDAFELHAASEPSMVSVIPGAGHTYGGRHPWTENELPPETRCAIKQTVAFICPDQKV